MCSGRNGRRSFPEWSGRSRGVRSTPQASLRTRSPTGWPIHATTVTTEPVLSFNVLGSLEVLDGERVIELPPGKQRMLLAALLLRAGEAVPTDTLIEQLWGERRPRTARGALGNNVSLLRKELGADVLLTRASGYVLDVRAEQTDVGHFERLLVQARAAPAAIDRERVLYEALALWRGPPFAELTFELFAELEINRLEDLRLAALQDLIDARLELGRDADLLADLDPLVQQHPFDERLRGQQVLALYRAGRHPRHVRQLRRVGAGTLLRCLSSWCVVRVPEVPP